MKSIGFGFAAIVSLASPVLLAHEHSGEAHAASAKECKSGAKSKVDRKVCMACVKQKGYHYHLDAAMKGDRCHDDKNDPDDKK